MLFLVYMYNTHPSYQTFIVGKNCAHYIRIFPVFTIGSFRVDLCVVDEFEDVLRHTELFARFPFDFESNFIRMQFGKDKSRPVNYIEFTQLLRVCLCDIVTSRFVKH